MTFTTSAFIRKNTPELRKKLEELGYYKMSENRIESDNITITIYPNGWYNLSYSNESNSAIDCSTNEALFLAIAALREDIDYMQWFLFEETISNLYFFKQYNKGDFYLCTKDKMELPYSRKATVQELIEHFK
ncbi:MAG: hypothetical protein ACK5M3_05405 [Dysgonomonas sp.]